MLCTFFWKALVITNGETTYFIIVKDGIKAGVAWLKANFKFYLQNVPIEKKNLETLQKGALALDGFALDTVKPCYFSGTASNAS